MKNRKFIEGEYQHVYQRTAKRHNIFYCDADYLVYFTIFCIWARKLKINILGLCLMIDHLHMLIQGRTKETVSRFISTVTKIFIHEYNSAIGRSGSLFEKRFGSATKQGRKKLVTTIVYIGNNPVEKKLCMRAEQYRWNFIAYLDSANPFSEKIKLRTASFRLRRSMKIVDWQHKQGRHLNYSLLRILFSGLNRKEHSQLTDYIIGKYNVLDKESLVWIFGSYENMLKAIHSTTGSEYDIKEDFNVASDTVYQDIREFITKNLTSDDIRKLTVIDMKEKIKVANRIKAHLGVPSWQIYKFLHL